MVSLRMTFVLLVVLVAVFSSAISTAAAEASLAPRVVQISSISSYPSDSDIIVSVSLNAGSKMADARLTVSVPELGISAKHRVGFSKNRKQTVHMELPIPTGLDPYLRIAFNSDQTRRIRHVPVILQ